MDEYISKHDAYTSLKDLEAAYIYPPVKEAYATAARRIDQMKAADVQPVKHGRWEYIRNIKLSGTIKLCECSQCHNKILGSLSYCGNCGADMTGGAENDT